ncbi:Hypothetical predicted protein [Octopus vulgaris]|uniref:Uncharacterized protein n=1 Tax=Octopus vulgaris TaxID=6645 RepID=A0AA36BH02_OCTVU|nr:Hypothetical predicted protein [Octopus vulgaris]
MRIATPTHRHPTLTQATQMHVFVHVSTGYFLFSYSAVGFTNIASGFTNLAPGKGLSVSTGKSTDMWYKSICENVGRVSHIDDSNAEHLLR